jgi:hypothetical protein
MQTPSNFRESPENRKASRRRWGCTRDHRTLSGLAPISPTARHCSLRVTAAVVSVVTVMGLADQATAQSYNYSQGNMWGTAPSGVAVPGALESALMHGQNSATAAAVNAASSGTLLGTGAGGGTINSIGSQTIVTNTVIGNNNPTTINATQSAINSGTVSNASQIGNSNN